MKAGRFQARIKLAPPYDVVDGAQRVAKRARYIGAASATAEGPGRHVEVVIVIEIVILVVGCCVLSAAAPAEASEGALDGPAQPLEARYVTTARVVGGQVDI